MGLWDSLVVWFCGCVCVCGCVFGCVCGCVGKWFVWLSGCLVFFVVVFLYVLLCVRL